MYIGNFFAFRKYFPEKTKKKGCFRRKTSISYSIAFEIMED